MTSQFGDLSAGGEDGSRGVILRPLAPDDVSDLVRITNDTGFFRPDEVNVAREVLTAAVLQGESSGYRVYVATDGQNRLGYVCFGPTPMTKSTWDLYWIAVDSRHQGRGIGRRLMRLAEEQILLQGGCRIVLDTSSQELYKPTRGFYCSLGYQEEGFIADFYDLGDGKVTFVKVLSR